MQWPWVFHDEVSLMTAETLSTQDVKLKTHLFTFSSSNRTGTHLPTVDRKDPTHELGKKRKTRNAHARFVESI